MLTSCRIQNIAIIEDVQLELGPGFNVLSGETGHGKSIIVQALQLIFGERGSADLIREGAEAATVTASFDVTGYATLKKILEDLDLPFEDVLTVKRTLSGNGKNRISINGSPATLKMLAMVTSELVDLASQHEHQILLKPEAHLTLLDTFAGLESERATFQKTFEDYQGALQDKQGLIERVQKAKEEEDYLRFQLQEMEGVDVKEGEEEALRQERELLKHGVKIAEICTQGESLTYSGDASLFEKLSGLVRELSKFSEIDPELKHLYDIAEEAQSHLIELGEGLGRYLRDLNFDPGRLEEIEDRLQALSHLKRKYGDLETALAKRCEMQKDLEDLEHFDEALVLVEEKVREKGEALFQAGTVLSKRRKEQAKRLEKEIEEEINALGFSKAQFRVFFHPPSSSALEFKNKSVDSRGLESAEFYFAPNLGEGLKPLAKIASGGELSRILLAVKKILGRSRQVATYVFDEVDSGIGGSVAEVVGQKLAELAELSQVICVTHLPQIACYAHSHFVIKKESKAGRTQTHVFPLKDKDREEEIARMLAGVEVSTKALAHAKEMLKNARI